MIVEDRLEAIQTEIHTLLTDPTFSVCWEPPEKPVNNEPPELQGYLHASCYTDLETRPPH
jgi:hypothetical protein